jgi:hypothetical protein
MNRTEEMPDSDTSSPLSKETSNETNSFVDSFTNNSDTGESSSSSSNPINLTNILILILIILVIFSYFGLNLLTILGNSFQRFSDITAPYVKQFLAAVGYSTGEVINKSADVTSDAAKIGIDIAEGTVQNIGDLFKKGASELDGNAKKSSDKNSSEKKPSLEQKINSKSEPKKKPEEVKPDSGENPIQKPISSAKQNWCLIGEYQNKRGCVAVTESDKCLSGQIFPSQQMCLNPTLTP